MMQLQETEVTTCPYMAAYIVAAILSFAYNGYIFVYAVQAFSGPDSFLLAVVGIVLCLCLHAFVMHICGFITLCMAKSEAVCMVRFVRISYWINFIVAAVVTTITFVFFILEKRQEDKTFLFLAFVIMAIGLILISLAWSMYVFYVFPNALVILPYFQLPYLPLALTKRYLP